VIETGNFKLDGGAIFGVVPKTMWSKVYPSDENNLINLSMRCLLVVDGKKKVLIDNGLGEKLDPKFLQYYFLNGDDSLDRSLAAVGVKPSEITDVVLSHLHFDHCGGSTRTDGSLTFPNATHWVSSSQWESAHAPNRVERPSFLPSNFDPLEKHGKLKLIDAEAKLSKNIRLKLFYGHTDGLIVPFISYNNKTLVYLADLIPTSAHIPLSFTTAYDLYPLVTIEEKEQFLTEAVENNYTMFFEHDVAVQCCTLQQTPRGVRIKDTLSLAEFAK